MTITVKLKMLHYYMYYYFNNSDGMIDFMVKHQSHFGFGSKIQKLI